MTDSDVEEPVHAQADSGGDKVIQAVEARPRRSQAGHQVDPLVGFAITVAVSQRGERGSVHDEERAVDPFEALDAPELLGEDAALAVLDRQDAIDGLGGRAGHIHRVGTDVEGAVGCGRDRSGEEHLAGIGGQLDFPARGGGRQAGGRSWRATRWAREPSTISIDVRQARMARSFSCETGGTGKKQPSWRFWEETDAARILARRGLRLNGKMRARNCRSQRNFTRPHGLSGRTAHGVCLLQTSGRTAHGVCLLQWIERDCGGLTVSWRPESRCRSSSRRGDRARS